jgi:hypothetical protein
LTTAGQPVSIQACTTCPEPSGGLQSPFSLPGKCSLLGEDLQEVDREQITLDSSLVPAS